jgi:predicted N-acetyltransferase YhbS
MDIVIREIEEKDYPEVTEILINELANNRSYADHVVPFFNKVKNDENHITFVAVLSNKVVGYISTVSTFSVGSSQVNTTLFVQSIAVKNEYQNKGIGTKLLKHTEDYAKAKGISGIGLQSGVQRTAAHAFYEHNGYIRSHYFYKNF